MTGALWSMADFLAYDPHPRTHGTEQRFRCPIHGGDRQKSMAVSAEGAYLCHNCGAKGLLTDFRDKSPRRDRRPARSNPFALAPARKVLPPAAKAPPATKSQVKSFPTLWLLDAPESAPARDFLAARGIPLAVAIATGARFAMQWKHAGVIATDPRVVFPIHSPSGELVAVQARSVLDVPPLEREKAYTYGPCGQGVFNPAGMDASPVILTEAPLKAMALIACGYPAVALCGSHISASWPYLAKVRGKAVLVGFDNDTGKEHERTEAKAKQAGLLLREAGAAIVKRLRPPDGFKDWDDVLRDLGYIELPELPETSRRRDNSREKTPQDAPGCAEPTPDVSEHLPKQCPSCDSSRTLMTNATIYCGGCGRLLYGERPAPVDPDAPDSLAHTADWL